MPALKECQSLSSSASSDVVCQLSDAVVCCQPWLFGGGSLRGRAAVWRLYRIPKEGGRTISIGALQSHHLQNCAFRQAARVVFRSEFAHVYKSLRKPY